MANPGGIITRKDIIEDEALAFGIPYQKMLGEIIAKHAEVNTSIAGLKTAFDSLKTSANNSDLIKAKEKEANATKSAGTALSETMKLEKQLQAVKEKSAALSSQEFANLTKEKLAYSTANALNNYLNSFGNIWEKYFNL